MLNKWQFAMTMKLEISSEVQAGLLSQAQRHGMSLEAYAESVLRERVRESAKTPPTRTQIAGQRIRELRKGVTLDGISIKGLIERRLVTLPGGRGSENAGRSDGGPNPLGRRVTANRYR
jgi:hypothetical protein